MGIEQWVTRCSTAFLEVLLPSSVCYLFFDLLKAVSAWKNPSASSPCVSDTSRLPIAGLSYIPDIVGGGLSLLKFTDWQPYIVTGYDFPEREDLARLRFVKLCLVDYQEETLLKNQVACSLDLSLDIMSQLTTSILRTVAQYHDMTFGVNRNKSYILLQLKEHVCKSCPDLRLILELTSIQDSNDVKRNWLAKQDKTSIKSDNSRKKSIKSDNSRKGSIKSSTVPLASSTGSRSASDGKNVSFPPPPPSRETIQQVISGFVKETAPSNFEETGCAVCAQLCPLKDLIDLKKSGADLDYLIREGVTRKERSSPFTPVSDIKGPILAPGCNMICTSCLTSLEQEKSPDMAISNGLWIGEIPLALQDLTIIEKMMIARIRHSYCVVKVAVSHRYKMKANVVCFSNPIPKVYNILPPACEELDEVIAFMYTGPCRPTPDDLKRTPLLVRLNKVRSALEWLKLNHKDYSDLMISDENLDTYTKYDCGVPVGYDYEEVHGSNKDPLTSAVNDIEEDEGTAEGPCPFTVHGLTGVALSNMRKEDITKHAIHHLKQGEKNVLFVGQNSEPESFFNNPQLYPQMFPHLFPYGYGGIQNELHKGRLSSMKHKRWLLMYYDKRFQTDRMFPLVALNMEQIKEASNAGYLLTQRKNIVDIANRITRIDQNVLDDMLERMKNGEHVKPQTEQERVIFSMLNDIDSVAGKVEGSMTSKKYARNEVWSLVIHLGAPTWFVTLSPADHNHPISLYFAGEDITFKPVIRDEKERIHMVAENPVAAARFFDVMVKAFIKHVVGEDADHPGLFGDVSAFFGMVEQQGRVTLHLHALLWIRNSLSPQEIRDRIMSNDSEFLKALVAYFEGCHVGEFTKPNEEVAKDIQQCKVTEDRYVDPRLVMPNTPAKFCECGRVDCKDCSTFDMWWDKYTTECDQLAYVLNRHTCHESSKSSSKRKRDGPEVRETRSVCKDSDGNCKARFPRELHDQTWVDMLTGALILKKGEAWWNTWTPALEYMIRCNTDTTCMLSGTAVKAVIAYITDYVVKMGIKSHVVFDAVRSVLSKIKENPLDEDIKPHQFARSVIVKIVNCLTARMETGSCMAAMYILGHEDCKTNFKFVNMYWRGYVQSVQRSWKKASEMSSEDAMQVDEPIPPEQVLLTNTNGQVVGVSKTDDYIYRGNSLADVCIYDFALNVTKRKYASDKKAQEYVDVDIKPVGGGVVEDQTESDEDSTLYDNDDEGSMWSGSTTAASEEFSDDSEAPSALRSSLHKRNMRPDEYKPEARCDKIELLPAHPQCKTHYLRLKESTNCAVNWIGGTLPRSDRGDREYYCMTMLTLFKPWHTPYDLKSHESTWEEAFDSYEFTDRHLQLMRNMNIRYECNDARDDHAAQRKKAARNPNIMASWEEAKDENSLLDTLDDLQNGSDDEDIDESHGDDPSQLGKSGLQQELDDIAARQMERKARNAGMYDESSERYHLATALPEFLADSQVPKTTWKDIVSNARKLELENMRAEINDPDNTDNRKRTRWNEVVVEDLGYIDRNFKGNLQHERDVIEDVIDEYGLRDNEEQQRAFRIVANHITCADPSQLRIFISGMAGTGKSQVIKAIKTLFSKRKERYRLIVVAPTGPAAAQVSGSTYHSALCLGWNNSKKGIETARTNLVRTDYVILDEISMLSSYDMYRISERECHIKSHELEPFGGMNMIFCGDFAQLPPVGGSALYARGKAMSLNARLTDSEQKNLIGKAIWHQVTTVVILRKNMRQRSASLEDNQFREVLSRMRYSSCSDDDIKWLKSRVAGRHPEQPKLAGADWRYVSVITARNVERDRLNELGAHRFAREMNCELVNFYSSDSWDFEDDPANSKKNKKARPPPKKMTYEMRQLLWSLQPYRTDNSASVLSLCIGMPVMIKYNEATELSVTNGQNAVVVDWVSRRDPDDGRRYLETLFVQLVNPLKDVQLDGLPMNVVPLVSRSSRTLVTFPDGDTRAILRVQVPVLLNFAMTDYNSQGRTLKHNIVNPTHLRDHRSVYTALSRGSSAYGTVLLDEIPKNKIQGKINGELRQEFRELELLDYITLLRYEGSLPKNVTGTTRNDLIYNFRVWKGTNFVPPNVPSSLNWTNDAMFSNYKAKNSVQWRIIQPGSNNILQMPSDRNIIPAIGTNPLKRGLDNLQPDKPSKRSRLSQFEAGQTGPAGFQWDIVHHSCAYDSVFTVLADIWLQDPVHINNSYRSINRYMRTFANGLSSIIKEDNTKSLESVRDDVRALLFARDPYKFHRRAEGTNLDHVITELVSTSDVTSTLKVHCTNCGDQVSRGTLSYVVHPYEGAITSTSGCVDYTQTQFKRNCPICQRQSDSTECYDAPPSLLFVEARVGTGRPLAITRSIKVLCTNNQRYNLLLRGVIYWNREGEGHFTCRVITKEREIWFNDGIATGRRSELEGKLNDFPAKHLLTCNNHESSFMIYAR